MNPFEDFQNDLAGLINKYSLESLFGDTPDYILSAFVVSVLIAFGKVTKKRDDWYDYPTKQSETCL